MAGSTLAALAIALLAFAGAWPFPALDRAWADALLRDAPGAAHSAARAVVVDIDGASVAAMGPWPWPRYRLAALVRRVADARPAAIGLDIVLAEPDRSSLARMQARMQHDFGVGVTFDGVPPGLMDNDDFLGATLERFGVIGASDFFFEGPAAGGPPPTPALSFSGRLDAIAPREATGVLADAPGIASRTRGSGFVDGLPDADGVLRRLPLVIRHAGVLHPSLALAAAARALGTSQVDVEAGRDGPRLRLGALAVPVDRRGDAWIRHPGGAAVPTVPAVDLVAGRIDPGALRGKVVFIGVSSAGADGIEGGVAAAAQGSAGARIAPRLADARVQAAMAQTLLAGESVVVPAWSFGAVALVAVASAALLAWLVARDGRARRVVPAGLVIAGLQIAGGIACFAGGCGIVSPALPLVVVALVCTSSLVLRQAAQRRRALARARQLERDRQTVLESLAAAAETRAPERSAHILRTQHVVRAIAQRLAQAGPYRGRLSDPDIELLYLAAPLHDVGKLGVPDALLHKPWPLTAQEMALMQLHAEFGRRIVQDMARGEAMGDYRALASEIAATHHERWDGHGYPMGLAGEAIPLSGRIMAVADVYDALVSRRCYKEPHPHAMATQVMQALRGTAFDPVVFDAFLEIEAQVQDIAARFQDDPAERPESAREVQGAIRDAASVVAAATAAAAARPGAGTSVGANAGASAPVAAAAAAAQTEAGRPWAAFPLDNAGDLGFVLDGGEDL